MKIEIGSKNLFCILALVFALSAAGAFTAFADEEPVTGEAAEEVNETAETAVPAPTEFAHFLTCTIENGDTVVLTGQIEGTWSDVSIYGSELYLFENRPYQRSLDGRSDYCAKITKTDTFSFSLPLNAGTADDRIYSSFKAAVFDGSRYICISNEAYITNPEAAAKYTDAYKTAQTKKGLLVQTTDDMLSDAFELGVSHVIVNIAFNLIQGTGIDYTYEGKTYHYSASALAEIDDTIRRMSEKSLTVTAVLLNGWSDLTPELYYPGLTKQPDTAAAYYGFHVATQEGYETLRATTAFLADRYSSLSSEYGRVSNWVIGNEINRQFWNYMGPMSLSSYIDEYARAFRVMYTAIRSTSATSRVFFSTDYNWMNTAEMDGSLNYTVRDLLDAFNNKIIPGGNIDWGLAYHPYSYPLTEPEFWNDEETGMVLQDVSSPIVNMGNLNVMTDYMTQSSIRDSQGDVRHIILSEQGFTSVSESRGEVYGLQAAAIAYAYYIADSNPCIDAFIMSRQVDAPSEAAVSCNFGLWRCDMSVTNDIVPTMRKQAWTVYKNIDNKKTTLETTEELKALIGIEKWSDVVPDFRWRSQENQ